MKNPAAIRSEISKLDSIILFAAFFVFLLGISCGDKKREINRKEIISNEVQHTAHKKPLLPPCSCNDKCTIRAVLEDRDYSISVPAFSKYLKKGLSEQDTVILNHLAHTLYGSGERYSTIRSVPEWDLSKPGCIELSIYIGSQSPTGGAYYYELNRRRIWFFNARQKKKHNLSFYQKLYFADTNSIEYAHIQDSLSQKPLKKVLFNQILTDKKEWGNNVGKN